MFQYSRVAGNQHEIRITETEHKVTIKLDIIPNPAMLFLKADFQ